MNARVYIANRNRSVIFYNRKISLIRPKMWLANGSLQSCFPHENYSYIFCSEIVIDIEH